MTTEVLERPVDQKNNTGDDIFHYVDKTKIVESAVTGSFVTALCKASFPVTKVPKPGSPVCGECQEIYDTLS
jgi:hypothetical protein